MRGTSDRVLCSWSAVTVTDLLIDKFNFQGLPQQSSCCFYSSLLGFISALDYTVILNASYWLLENVIRIKSIVSLNRSCQFIYNTMFGFWNCITRSLIFVDTLTTMVFVVAFGNCQIKFFKCTKYHKLQFLVQSPVIKEQCDWYN